MNYLTNNIKPGILIEYSADYYSNRKFLVLSIASKTHYLNVISFDSVYKCIRNLQIDVDHNWTLSWKIVS